MAIPLEGRSSSRDAERYAADISALEPLALEIIFAEKWQVISTALPFYLKAHAGTTRRQDLEILSTSGWIFLGIYHDMYADRSSR